MSDTRVKCHPELGILVCTDGHVMVPKSGTNPAHWTFGSKNALGYMTVRIAKKTYLVHRLVAQTFLGEIPEGYQVDHINRCPSANFLSNLRIVTPSQNCRNTSRQGRIEARGGIHWYEDARQYWREYRVENKETIREKKARYYVDNKDEECKRVANYKQDKRKTHRVVTFSDGRQRWVPNEEALELLKLPLKQRFIKETRT